MNVDIQQTVKQCATCLDYQHTQQQERAVHYEIPYKPWEVVDADIFMVNNKTFLSIVDIYSKFPILNKVAGF